jgi:hypothetical protein
MPAADKAHLSQRELEETEYIKDILKELQRWLETADFGPDDNKLVHTCQDDGLPKASEPLLFAIGFEQEVLTVYGIMELRLMYRQTHKIQCRKAQKLDRSDTYPNLGGKRNSLR